MNQLEQLMKSLEESNDRPIVLKIEGALVKENINDFITQVENSKANILCLSSDKKAEELLSICEMIPQDTSLIRILELPFHRVFSYGIKEFVERASNAGISGFHVLELPYEEQGQMVVHLLDTDGPCLLQEVTISSGDRIPSILEYARGFAWCSDKGYSKQLSELPGDAKEYYLFAVDAVSSLPVVLDFSADSEKEVATYLDTASGFIAGKGLERAIKETGYSNELVCEYCKKL